MHKNSRVLLIQDIRSFCIMMIGFCKQGVMQNYNMQPSEHIDLFIDWSINELLTNDFNLRVVGHYRNDEYKCILHEVYQNALITLRGSVSLVDLDLIKGFEVKTMITGYDLFISPRTIYRYYL